MPYATRMVAVLALLCGAIGVLVYQYCRPIYGKEGIERIEIQFDANQPPGQIFEARLILDDKDEIHRFISQFLGYERNTRLNVSIMRISLAAVKIIYADGHTRSFDTDFCYWSDDLGEEFVEKGASEIVLAHPSLQHAKGYAEFSSRLRENVAAIESVRR